MAHGSIYNDKVVWIKLEGIEGGSIWTRMCLYAHYSHGKETSLAHNDGVITKGL
jgi:hypothetical protein